MNDQSEIVEAVVAALRKYKRGENTEFMGSHTEQETEAAATALLRDLARLQRPVAFIRTLNGEIDWAEDCLCDNEAQALDWLRHDGEDDGYGYLTLYPALGADAP